MESLKTVCSICSSATSDYVHIEDLDELGEDGDWGGEICLFCFLNLVVDGWKLNLKTPRLLCGCDSGIISTRLLDPLCEQCNTKNSGLKSPSTSFKTMTAKEIKDVFSLINSKSKEMKQETVIAATCLSDEW